MKAGILAAGLGERLREGGLDLPKPLVPIAGVPMIARAIRNAAEAGATSVACIVNEIDPEVSVYLNSHPWPVDVQMVVKTTASSMESLFALAPLLEDETFLLLTVDAVFPPGALDEFLRQARALEQAQGVLALTRFIDDEKPLWARMASSGEISALGEEARPGPFATAGFYFFQPGIFSLIQLARTLELTALRQFLALLPRSGYPLWGVPVAKTIDVDRPADREIAEAMLGNIDENR